MKIVLTYGTFDLLHAGHINLLRRAKDLGDYLIVGLSTDTFNVIKHKESFFSFKERKHILESIKYVDRIIPEKTWEQKRRDILKYHVNILVMGSDWKGKFDDLSDICAITYVPRTKNISTSRIKHTLASRSAQ